MSKSCIAALLLVAGTALAQHRTTELEARSYITSAFITGAAQAILSADVALGPQLRERLALPPNADRDRIYEAIFALTDGKPLRVRKSSALEAAGLASQAAGRPVFALEGGAAPLLMVYDLDRDAIPYVALLGSQPAVGSTAAPAEPTVIHLEPVTFGFDDATLDPAARAALEHDGLPKLAAMPAVRYVVYGHADRLGTPDYNQRLSERRARAVRDYLVEKGVPPRNIEAVGLGASRPQASCAHVRRRALIECLAPDRRAAIEVRPAAM